jgi:hypothetical protein
LTVPGVLTVAVTVTGVPKAAVVALEGRATEVVVEAGLTVIESVPDEPA